MKVVSGAAFDRGGWKRIDVLKLALHDVTSMLTTTVGCSTLTEAHQECLGKRP
jgi:hypothetical protein